TPADVLEHYPAALPPLRGDAPTLMVGRMRPAKELTFTIEGTVPGRGRVSVAVRETAQEPEVDNYFLVGMLTQWKQAARQPALVRGDRALALAYEASRLDLKGRLATARLFLEQDKLDAAAKLFEEVRAVNPADIEARAGLKVVASLRSGTLTRDV